AWATHCQVEGIAHNPLAALLCEHCLLDRRLKFGALIHAPADGRILTLIVLAHNPIVDFAGSPVGKRRLKALEQTYRPQVDVLLKLSADWNQKAPKRDVVRHIRPADSTEKNRIVMANLLKPVLRHHSPLFLKALARPIEVMPLPSNVKAPPHCFEH